MVALAVALTITACMPIGGGGSTNGAEGGATGNDPAGGGDEDTVEESTRGAASGGEPMNAMREGSDDEPTDLGPHQTGTSMGMGDEAEPDSDPDPAPDRDPEPDPDPEPDSDSDPDAAPDPVEEEPQCRVDQDCLGTLVCEDGDCVTSCADFDDCVRGCEGDERCFDRCVEMASAAGYDTWVTVAECIQNSGCALENTRCWEATCEAELGACFGPLAVPAGDATCRELAECLSPCDAYACADRCITAASPEGYRRLIDVIECYEANGCDLSVSNCAPCANEISSCLSLG